MGAKKAGKDEPVKRVVLGRSTNNLKMGNLLSACCYIVHVARIIAVDHISSNPDAAAGDHPDIAGTTKEFFMHDILGGSSPTARPITGLLGSIYSSQVPFARPIGFTIPRGGVPIPNANGDIPTINCNNGIPLRTGLSGTTFSQPANGPAPNVQRQLGPNGLGLGFGRITVIDDLLMVGPDVGLQTIRKAQGVYLVSSADGTTQMMAFTAMIEGGQNGDSLSFFGVYKTGSAMSHLSVTGGTGKFKNACGLRVC